MTKRAFIELLDGFNDDDYISFLVADSFSNSSACSFLKLTSCAHTGSPKILFSIDDGFSNLGYLGKSLLSFRRPFNGLS